MECAPSILHMWDETVNKIILNTKPIVWFFGLKVTYLTLSQVRQIKMKTHGIDKKKN